MIPKAARVSGMYRVDMSDENASGKALHRITTSKISQVWLASQTGPIEASIRSAGLLAPVGVAGQQVPQAGPEVGSAEDRVGRDAQPQHERHDDRRWSWSASSHWPGRTGRPTALASAAPCRLIERSTMNVAVPRTT